MIISSLFTAVLVLDRFEKLIHVKQLLQKKKEQQGTHQWTDWMLTQRPFEWLHWNVMGVVNKLSGKQGGVACGSPAMMCCFCRFFFFIFVCFWSSLLYECAAASLCTLYPAWNRSIKLNVHRCLFVSRVFDKFGCQKILSAKKQKGQPYGLVLLRSQSLLMTD